MSVKQKNKMSRNLFQSEYRKRRAKKILSHLNMEPQSYKFLTLRMEKRDYVGISSKLFRIDGVSDTVWIPNQYLSENGTLLPEVNYDRFLVKQRLQRHLSNKANYSNYQLYMDR